MIIEVIFDYSGFKENESELLWKQGVCLDDWDYLLVCPLDSVEKNNDGELQPKEYGLERMLTGCCHNTWYIATFRGNEVAIGVAYHS